MKDLASKYGSVLGDAGTASVEKAAARVQENRDWQAENTEAIVDTIHEIVSCQLLNSIKSNTIKTSINMISARM